MFKFSFIILLIIESVVGHIIFTFPEPRYPPFDFLDNRTLGPCGVPKTERSQLTTFQIGRNYNISWNLAKPTPKEDKVRIRLLDYEGKELESEKMSLITTGQITNAIQQYLEIRFHNVCRNCTLLLEKLEFQTSSMERSCAEVDIYESAPINCFGNGLWKEEEGGGLCQCLHGFSGQYCQHKDDCVKDLECGPGGKCIENGIRRGHKSCFCQFGYFGTNCERRSDPDPEDQNCFRHVSTSPVAEANGNLRYGLFNPECYSSKTLNEKEMDKELEDDRLHWRLVGNQLELLLDFWTSTSLNWIGLGWRPLQIPSSCRLFPQIISPFEQKIAKTSGFSREWLEQPLRPMECVDIIIGSIREGNLLHIEDLYSRDMSTPLRDSLLDGEESLSAAYGLKIGNRSLLMFRRLISEIEPTDHPLGPGSIFVIYAKGQTKLGDGSDNQWKYHGDKNRGHMEIEFVKQSQMSQLHVPLVHFSENEHNEKTTDIPTEVFESNSQEFERKIVDDTNIHESSENDEEKEPNQNNENQSSIAAFIKPEIIRILFLIYLITNLMIA